MKRPKLYMPKKGEVATLPGYDPFKSAYRGKDSREGRLSNVQTDRGQFRIKDNFRGENG